MNALIDRVRSEAAIWKDSPMGDLLADAANHLTELEHDLDRARGDVRHVYIAKAGFAGGWLGVYPTLEAAWGAHPSGSWHRAGDVWTASDSSLTIHKVAVEYAAETRGAAV